MGFYIRKSFKVGPLRLNVSKSGLGVSAGVRGARLGVDAKGRAYTHAGRFGLYHREYLSGGDRRETARAVPSSSRLPDEEIDVATNATYPAKLGRFSGGMAPNATQSIKQPNRPAFSLALAAFSLLMLGVFGQSQSASWWVTTAFFFGAVALFAVAIRNIRVERARASLERAVAKAMRTGPDSAGTQSVEEQVRKAQLPRDDIDFVGKSAFAEWIFETVDDRRVEADEKARLTWCERTFELDGNFVLDCKVAVFQAAFLEAMADRIVTAEEEAALSHVRTELGIPEHAITEMQETILELAEVRRVREGELREIGTTRKLQRNEKCYFEAPGRLLKYKILRSFTENRVRHKMKGYEIAKEGTLLLTSKRVTLRHEGTSNIPYDKILEVDVDADRNLITLVKDGVQRPVFITTPSAIRAGAIIAQLADV